MTTQRFPIIRISDPVTGRVLLVQRADTSHEGASTGGDEHQPTFVLSLYQRLRNVESRAHAMKPPLHWAVHMRLARILTAFQPLLSFGYGARIPDDTPVEAFIREVAWWEGYLEARQRTGVPAWEKLFFQRFPTPASGANELRKRGLVNPGWG